MERHYSVLARFSCFLARGLSSLLLAIGVSGEPPPRISVKSLKDSVRVSKHETAPCARKYLFVGQQKSTYAHSVSEEGGQQNNGGVSQTRTAVFEK